MEQQCQRRRQQYNIFPVSVINQITALYIDPIRTDLHVPRARLALVVRQYGYMTPKCSEDYSHHGLGLDLVVL